MIKLNKVSSFDPVKGYTRSLTGGVVCKTKAKTRWYSLGRHEKHWSWKAVDEPVIAPQLLTTWSK
jgi:hypothetical protein